MGILRSSIVTAVLCAGALVALTATSDIEIPEEPEQEVAWNYGTQPGFLFKVKHERGFGSTVILIPEDDERIFENVTIVGVDFEDSVKRWDTISVCTRSFQFEDAWAHCNSISRGPTGSWKFSASKVRADRTKPFTEDQIAYLIAELDRALAQFMA